MTHVRFKEKYEGKEAIYKEGIYLYHIKIISVKVNEQTFVAKAEILGNMYAKMDAGDIEYITPTTRNAMLEPFEFGGAWEIVSENENQLSLMYVGARINFSAKVISQFVNRDTNFYQVWIHS